LCDDFGVSRSRTLILATLLILPPGWDSSAYLSPLILCTTGSLFFRLLSSESASATFSVTLSKKLELSLTAYRLLETSAAHNATPFLLTSRILA
jgi:hypothetical protein